MGRANGVDETVDQINTAEVTTTFAAEISAGEGHDIVEHIASLGQFEGSLLDMTDVVEEAMNRHGEMSGVTQRSGFNPTTDKYFSFVHGYAPDQATIARACGKRSDIAKWTDNLAGTPRRWHPNSE